MTCRRFPTAEQHFLRNRRDMCAVEVQDVAGDKAAPTAEAM